MVHKVILTLCLLMFSCAPETEMTSTVTEPAADAELEAAIRTARQSLDTFKEKIGTPHPDRTFVAVKVRFTPPDNVPQEIWVDEVTYIDGVLQGSMGDEIPSMRLTAGETIRVDEKDIVDWMIVEEGKLIGGYTIRLAVLRMSPEEREQFLETLDYSIED